MKQNKHTRIIIQAIPIALMLSLIPLVENEFILTGLYTITIAIAFFLQLEKRDMFIFIFGILIMTLCEYLFVSTGVETFTRTTLLGVMPLWLPLLWGYAFVAIKRSIRILEE